MNIFLSHAVSFFIERMMTMDAEFIRERITKLRLQKGVSESVSYTHLDVYKRQGLHPAALQWLIRGPSGTWR